MHVHLDPIGGIAGDMFAAAVLDAWPEYEADLIAALEVAGISSLATVERRDHIDHAMSGSRFEVREVAVTPNRARRYQDIREFFQSADLARRVEERALHILELIATAESTVHGVGQEEVSFHEVGAWDSITDIVSAAWLIEALEGATWSCEALPLGRGRVRTAHGLLPLPAPATVVLLEGFPTFQDEHRGERVTPTGAAILRHLNPSFEPVPGILRLSRSGTGFGTKVFEGLSNTLRLLVLEPMADSYRSNRVSVCTFEVDDQTGEDLAVALDRVRGTAGVLDVTQSTVYGKKGRVVVSVQVLAQPEAVRRALDACLRETTTLGIRWQTVERAVLDREEQHVQIAGRTVSVKSTKRPGAIVTAKAAMDHLAEAEGGWAGRDLLRREAEALAADNRKRLREEKNGE